MSWKCEEKNLIMVKPFLTLLSQNVISFYLLIAVLVIIRERTLSLLLAFTSQRTGWKRKFQDNYHCKATHYLADVWLFLYFLLLWVLYDNAKEFCLLKRLRWIVNNSLSSVASSSCTMMMVMIVFCSLIYGDVRWCLWLVTFLRCGLRCATQV